MENNEERILKAYCKRGLKIVPVRKGQKAPAIKNFLNDASSDFEQIKKWAEAFPGCNWGLPLSTNGLVAIDVDRKHGGLEAWDALIADWPLEELDTWTATTGSGGKHLIFKEIEGDSVSYRGKIRDGIDIRYNHIVVIFPSIHPDTKARYKWDKSNVLSTPILATPERLRKYITKDPTLKGKSNPTFKFGKDYLSRLVEELKKYELSYEEWLQAGMALHSADDSQTGLDLYLELTNGPSYQDGDEQVAIQKWESFKRDDEDGAISLATLGFLIRSKGGTTPNPHYESDKAAFMKMKVEQFKNTETEAYDTFMVETDENGEETGNVISKNKRVIVKYFNELGYAYLGEGEQKFPIIKVSDEGKGILSLKPMTSKGFIEATKHLKYKFAKILVSEVRDAYQPAAEIWLDSKDKRRFMNPTFNPDPVARLRKGTLNLFTGYCVEPVKLPQTEALSRLLDMIEKSLCGGDSDAKEWLLDYLGHLIQKPWQKPTVVPVIIGLQGTGKGLLFDMIMRRILGALFTSVKTAKDLTAQFNDELANKLLTMIDEATWRGNHVEDGVLKNLTGSNVMKVEIKYGPKYEVDNFSRYVITSNNSEAVAIESSNRRYYVIECSSEFAGDTSYFNPIWDDVRDGTLVEEFLNFLMERDIEAWDYAKIPEGNTRGKVAKAATGGAIFEFWKELFEGDYEPTSIEPLWVEGKYLRQVVAYQEFLYFMRARNRHERSISAVKFWRETKKFMPAIGTNFAKRINGKTSRVFATTKIDMAFSMAKTNAIEVNLLDFDVDDPFFD